LVPTLDRMACADGGDDGNDADDTDDGGPKMVP
jgi:hypothetical protein